jgi:hypothetical protein
VTEEPTLGELSRILDREFGHVREDIAQLAGRLDRVVPVDVYRAEQRLAEQRTAGVEQRVTAIEQRAERRPDRFIATAGVVIALLSLALALVATIVN